MQTPESYLDDDHDADLWPEPDVDTLDRDDDLDEEAAHILRDLAPFADRQGARS